jgi:hypothetical protein
MPDRRAVHHDLTGSLNFHPTKRQSRSMLEHRPVLPSSYFRKPPVPQDGSGAFCCAKGQQESVYASALARASGFLSISVDTPRLGVARCHC